MLSCSNCYNPMKYATLTGGQVPCRSLNFIEESFIYQEFLTLILTLLKGYFARNIILETYLNLE